MPLRGIQRVVGSLEHVLQAADSVFFTGNRGANERRHHDVAPVDCGMHAARRSEQAFAHHGGPFSACPGQHDDEFHSAMARDDIAVRDRHRSERI